MPSGVYVRDEHYKFLLGQARMHILKKKQTKETIQKRIATRKNNNQQWHSEETKKKIGIANSIANKGHSPWNKGKTKENYPRLSNSGARKGNIPFNKGKHLSEAHRRNLKIAMNQEETLEKKSGKNHYNWKNGKSFEIYPLGWSETFKEQIRRRDEYKCKICLVPEIETKKRHDVHHIDYDKKNLLDDNLITLCRKCHMKTNYNRTYWKIFLNSYKKDKDGSYSKRS